MAKTGRRMQISGRLMRRGLPPPAAPPRPAARSRRRTCPLTTTDAPRAPGPGDLDLAAAPHAGRDRRGQRPAVLDPVDDRAPLLQHHRRLGHQDRVGPRVDLERRPARTGPGAGRASALATVARTRTARPLTSTTGRAPRSVPANSRLRHGVDGDRHRLPRAQLGQQPLGHAEIEVERVDPVEADQLVARRDVAADADVLEADDARERGDDGGPLEPGPRELELGLGAGAAPTAPRRAPAPPWHPAARAAPTRRKFSRASTSGRIRLVPLGREDHLVELDQRRAGRRPTWPCSNGSADDPAADLRLHHHRIRRAQRAGGGDHRRRAGRSRRARSGPAPAGCAALRPRGRRSRVRPGAPSPRRPRPGRGRPSPPRSATRFMSRRSRAWRADAEDHGLGFRRSCRETSGTRTK